MAEVTVLKNTRRQAVVSAVGTGTFWCNLSALLYSNVNGQIDQTLSVANAELTISDIIFNTQGVTTIKRNGSNVWILSAGESDFSFTKDYGFVLNPNTSQLSNANVTINFENSYGSVILGFTKGQGFNDRDLQLIPEHRRWN